MKPNKNTKTKKNKKARMLKRLSQIRQVQDAYFHKNTEMNKDGKKRISTITRVQ